MAQSYNTRPQKPEVHISWALGSMIHSQRVAMSELNEEVARLVLAKQTDNLDAMAGIARGIYKASEIAFGSLEALKTQSPSLNNAKVQMLEMKALLTMVEVNAAEAAQAREAQEV